MSQRLNYQSKSKLGQSLVFVTFMALLLFVYFLIPIYLGDDIYLSILIPYFQWIILGTIGLTTLFGVRLCCAKAASKAYSSNEVTLSTIPSDGRKKFSITAISQFLMPPTWSIEFMQKLSSAQFTQLCLAYYEIKGIPHTTHQLGSSTGLNILIWQNSIVSKVIHCSNDQIVEMNAVRQFLGVMVHERAHAGVYIHRGEFGDEVRNFSASHNIQLRNEYALLAKIEKLSDRRKQQLLKMI